MYDCRIVDYFLITIGNIHKATILRCCLQDFQKLPSRQLHITLIFYLNFFAYIISQTQNYFSLHKSIKILFLDVDLFKVPFLPQNLLGPIKFEIISLSSLQHWLSYRSNVYELLPGKTHNWLFDVQVDMRDFPNEMVNCSQTEPGLTLCVYATENQYVNFYAPEENRSRASCKGLFLISSIHWYRY